MRKYQLDDSKMEFRPQGPYYIAAEADARIAELEKALLCITAASGVKLEADQNEDLFSNTDDDGKAA